nr:phospholipase D family protein [Halomonas sp. UBA3074]
MAWVNQPGAKRILESAKNFLAEGGCIRATVGLDFSSTSYEGLRSLLNLEGEGSDIKTHVFFDENRACTFHPKVFLFKNHALARLFVGSNNMTGAGMNTNIEVALGFTGGVDDETIEAIQETLEGWRDESSDSRARRLTSEFLEELHCRGYVRTEEELKNSREYEAGSTLSEREPLFGKSKTGSNKQVSRGGSQALDGGRTTTSGSTEVLLMRVRPRRDGKQFQISMRVYQGSFMNNADEVVSAVNHAPREVGYSKRNGRQNTARFEAPELQEAANPVARFQWVGTPNSVLQYEIFDADDNGEGAKIYRKLMQGISTPPVTRLERLSTETTVLSKSDKEKAQWYRMDYC